MATTPPTVTPISITDINHLLVWMLPGWKFCSFLQFLLLLLVADPISHWHIHTHEQVIKCFGKRGMREYTIPVHLTHKLSNFFLSDLARISDLLVR